MKVYVVFSEQLEEDSCYEPLHNINIYSTREKALEKYNSLKQYAKDNYNYDTEDETYNGAKIYYEAYDEGYMLESYFIAYIDEMEVK